MDKLRVVLALGYYEGGGFTTVVNELARALIKSGHEVYIAARVMRLKPPKWLEDHVKQLTPKELSQLAKSVDVIHIHASFPYTRQLVSDGHRNIVFTWHGFPPLKYIPTIRDKIFDFIILKMYGKYLKKIRSVTAVGYYCSLQLKKMYGIDAKVIYNGVNVEIFKRCDGKRGPWNNHYPVIFTTGGYNILKGSDLLVKFYKAIKQAYPNSLFIAHSNSSIAGLSDVVTFGFIPYEELSKHYCQAHVFLLPSKWECLPLPPLEAMATGTPVLALDPRVTIGHEDGRSEIINMSGGGLLFSNENDLVDKLKMVLEDWEAFSNRAYSFAIRMTWDNIVAQYLEIYRETLRYR